MNSTHELSRQLLNEQKPQKSKMFLSTNISNSQRFISRARTDSLGNGISQSRNDSESPNTNIENTPSRTTEHNIRTPSSVQFTQTPISSSQLRAPSSAEPWRSSQFVTPQSTKTESSRIYSIDRQKHKNELSTSSKKTVKNTSVSKQSQKEDRIGKRDVPLTVQDLGVNRKSGYASTVLSMSSLTPQSNSKFDHISGNNTLLNSNMSNLNRSPSKDFILSSRYANFSQSNDSYIQNLQQSIRGNSLSSSERKTYLEDSLSYRSDSQKSSPHKLITDISPNRRQSKQFVASPLSISSSRTTPTKINSPEENTTPAQKQASFRKSLPFSQTAADLPISSQSIGYTSLNNSQPLQSDNYLSNSTHNDISRLPEEFKIQLSTFQDQIQSNISDNNRSIKEMQDVFKSSFIGLLDVVKRLEDKVGDITPENEEKILSKVLNQINERVDSAIKSKSSIKDDIEFKGLIQTLNEETKKISDQVSRQDIDIQKLEGVVEKSIQLHQETEMNIRSFVQQKLEGKNHQIDELRARVEDFDDLITHSNIVEDLKRKIELVDDIKDMIDRVDLLKEKIDDVENLSQKIDDIEDLKVRILLLEKLKEELKSIEELKTSIVAIEDIQSRVQQLEQFLENKVNTKDFINLQNKLDSLEHLKEKARDIDSLKQQLYSLRELEDRILSLGDLEEKLTIFNNALPLLDDIEEMKEKINVIESIQSKILDMEQEIKLRDTIVDKQFDELIQQQKSDQDIQDNLSQVVSERMLESENRIRNSLQSLLATKHFRRPLIKDIVEELKTLPRSPMKSPTKSPTKFEIQSIEAEVDRIHEKVEDLEKAISNSFTSNEGVHNILNRITSLSHDVSNIQIDLDQRFIDMRSQIKEIVPTIVNESHLEIRNSVFKSFEDTKKFMNIVMDVQSKNDIRLSEFKKELATLSTVLNESVIEINNIQNNSNTQSHEQSEIHILLNTLQKELKTIKDVQSSESLDLEKRFKLIIQSTNEALESNMKRFISIEESRLKSSLDEQLEIQNEINLNNLKQTLQASLDSSLERQVSESIESYMEVASRQQFKELVNKFEQLIEEKLDSARKDTKAEIKSLIEKDTNEFRDYFENKIASVQKIVDTESKKREQLSKSLEFTKEDIKIINNDISTLRNYTSEVNTLIHRIEILEKNLTDETERYFNLKHIVESARTDIASLELTINDLKNNPNGLNENQVKILITQQIQSITKQIDSESQKQIGLRKSLEQLKKDLSSLHENVSKMITNNNDSKYKKLLDRIVATELAVDSESKKQKEISSSLQETKDSLKKIISTKSKSSGSESRAGDVASSNEIQEIKKKLDELMKSIQSLEESQSKTNEEINSIILSSESLNLKTNNIIESIDETTETLNQVKDDILDLKENGITTDQFEEKIDKIAQDIENGTLVVKPLTIRQKIVKTVFNPRLWFLNLPFATLFAFIFITIYEILFPINVTLNSFNTIS